MQNDAENSKYSYFKKMLLLARIEMEISALMDLFDFFVRLRPETLERCENFCRMQYSKFGKVCIEFLLQD